MEEKFKLWDFVVAKNFTNSPNKMQIVKVLENGWFGIRYVVVIKDGGRKLEYVEMHEEELSFYVERKTKISF